MNDILGLIASTDKSPFGRHDKMSWQIRVAQDQGIGPGTNNGQLSDILPPSMFLTGTLQGKDSY